MKALILSILIATPAAAQMPQQVDDAAIMENQEFLLQEIRRQKSIASGRYIMVTSSPTFTSQVEFEAQITISSNIVFASEFHNSSSTISMPTGTITQTTYNLCIATLTITTHGNSRIAVHASQSGTQDTAAKNLTPFYKIDGGTAVVGPTVTSITAGYNFPFNLNMITGVLTEGTYSICIGARVNGNTYTLANSADSGGWFWIEELR